METDALGLLEAVDNVTTDHDVGSLGGQDGEPIVGHRPVGAFIEVQQGDVHIGDARPCTAVQGQVVDSVSMRIGELAAACGLTNQAIRFYERKGLLPPPERGPNGYREYADSILGRLEFIRSGQAAGLTLDEVARVLDVRDRGDAPCSHVNTLLATKLGEVRERQRELRRLEVEIENLIARSELLDPRDCAEGQICNILAAGG